MPPKKAPPKASTAPPTVSKAKAKALAGELQDVIRQTQPPGQAALPPTVAGAYNVSKAVVDLSDDFQLVTWENIPTKYKTKLNYAHLSGTQQFAKCKHCDAGYLWASHRDNYVGHTRECLARTSKSNEAPKTPQRQGIKLEHSDSPPDHKQQKVFVENGNPAMYYVVAALIFSGVSILQLSRILYCLAPILAYMELSPDIRYSPPAYLYTPIWEGTKRHCEELFTYISHTIGTRKFQIAIDGGMSGALRQHCLVVCVFVDSKCYALPPQYTDKPLSAKDIHVAVVKALSYINKSLEDVSFVVLDGAANNWAFIDQIEYVLTPEDQEWMKKEGTSTHQIKEFIREHFSGRAIYCRGHFIKVVIDHCKETLESTHPSGMSAVELFRNIFFNNPGRVGRFRAFYDDSLQTMRDNQPALATKYQDLLGARDVFTQKQWINEVKKVFPQATLLTVDACVEALNDAIEGIDQDSQQAKRQKALSPVLGNDTRWLRSKYEAFAFVFHHRTLIQNFLIKEGRSGYACNSLTSLMTLLKDTSTREKVFTDLQSILEFLQPFAAYMRKFSDFSTGGAKARALEVFTQDEDLLEQINAMPPGPLKDVAVKSFTEVRPGSERQNDLWMFIRWLQPSFASIKLQELKGITARKVKEVSKQDFNETEWTIYQSQVQNDPHKAKMSPLAWWEIQTKLPTLKLVAKSLLELMPTGTSCDSIMSLEGAMMTSRRSSTTPEHTAWLVAAKANGDFKGESPFVNHWFGDTRSAEERAEAMAEK